MTVNNEKKVLCAGYGGETDGKPCRRSPGWGANRDCGPCRDHENGGILPVQLPGYTPPPGHLSAESQLLWSEILRDWDLTTDGVTILKTALESYDRMNHARQKIDEEGLYEEDPSGRRRRNPACQIEKDQRRIFLQYWKELNLDVSPPD